MARAVQCVLILALLACVYATDKNCEDGASCSSSTSRAQGPVVESAAGRFVGSWMESRRGRRVQAYRGVRYAQAPVGELRFQAPVLMTRYEAEVDASAEGPACPQPAVTPGFVVHEDCLRLNVYTPQHANSSSALPVVVYIHPGGFYSVSGRSDIAGPRYLLDKDVVLVTINYRLGSLGFLATGDKWAVGNYGLKDQVAALRWVRANIAAFGGDPQRVTAAGYSAGSFSIALHMLSPMGKGLFQRAISMSASPLSQVVVGTHQRHLAARQARLLGCPDKDSESMVKCLKTKPWKEFGDSLDDMFEFGYDPVLLWNAVIEPECGQERYLTEQPLTTLQAGKAMSVPYIVSQTKDEFFWKAFNVLNNATMFATMRDEWSRIAPISFMLPAKGYGAGATADVASDRLKRAYFGGKQLANDSRTADALGKLYSDAVIGFAAHSRPTNTRVALPNECMAVRERYPRAAHPARWLCLDVLARLMSRHSSAPVYQYEFSYVGTHSHYEDPVTKKPTGAAHHDELIYLFSIPAAFPDIPLGDTDDSRMVDTLVDMWYNFANTGDPNPVPGVRWPAFTPAERRYLRVDKQLSLHEKLFEDRYTVWNELYPVQY